MENTMDARVLFARIGCRPILLLSSHTTREKPTAIFSPDLIPCGCHKKNLFWGVQGEKNGRDC